MQVAGILGQVAHILGQVAHILGQVARTLQGSLAYLAGTELQELESQVLEQEEA